MSETTALATWDPNSGAALPAYLANALDDVGTNIPDRQTVPSLSYEGKNWSIVKDGNKTKIQAKNSDGDMVPVPIMRVVILNFNADRGRAFYEGGYNPAATAKPICWSGDGKAPDPSVTSKQSPLCQGCPQSVKGSRVVDGREMVACSSHRLLVVCPPDFDETAGLLRLKIAVTSDYDKEIVEHGWFAFRQYIDWLKSRGITNTALVVTKIKFDTNAEYPKLLFALDRILSANEVDQVKVALAKPQVADLLSEKWTAAGSAGTPTNDSDIDPQAEIPRPKPDNEAYIANAGTAGELWWDGTAWVKPWITEAAAPPAPPPPPAPEPEPAAAEPPRVPKPDNPDHVAHAGTPNEVWWNGAEWVKPWVAEEPKPEAAAPPPPPAPAPEPEPAAPPKPTDPAHIAHAGTANELWWDGAAWVAPWLGNAAAPATPAAPAGSGNAATAADPATSGAGTTATSGASPSDGGVPADVQSLLDKWTS